jgi:integrase/recombinase XerD
LFLLGNLPCNIMSNNVACFTRFLMAQPRFSQAYASFSAPSDAASLYAPTGARKYLNAEERRRTLAVMAELSRDKALFALTLAWTGARVSEVLALRAESFQIEAGVIAFQTLKRRRHAMREVPIPPELMAALDAYFTLGDAQQDLFAKEQLLWPWCRSTAWRLVKRVMVGAGVMGRAASPRGLRHGFGVGTLQAGVPLNLLQRWLGHARISTTALYAAACGPDELTFATRFWGDGLA